MKTFWLIVLVVDGGGGCTGGGGWGGAGKQGDTIAQSICKDALDDKVKVESTI